MAEQNDKIVIAELDIDLKTLIKNAAEAKKVLEGLKAEQKELKKDVENNAEAIVENEAAVKSVTAAYNTQVKAINQFNDAIAKQEARQDLLNAVLDQEVSSIEEARAQNKLLNDLRNSANLTTEKGVQELQDLNTQLDRNNKFIKDNLDAYGKQKINIGNYTESIIDAYNALEEQKKALEENKVALQKTISETDKASDTYNILNQQLNVVNIQINNVNQSMDEARGKTKGFSDNLALAENGVGSLREGLIGLIDETAKTGNANEAIKGSFKNVTSGIAGATKAGLAFIATPIGATITAIVAAGAIMFAMFKTGVNEFRKTEQGSAKLDRSMAKLTSILSPLTKAFKFLSKLLVDSVLDTFNKVYDAGIILGNMFGDLVNKLGFTGVGGAIKGITNGIAENAKQQEIVNKLAAEYEKRQLGARKLQLEYQKGAEKLRQIRDDTTKSDAQRIAAAKELGVLLDKQVKDEVAVQKINLRRIDEELKLRKDDKELLAERMDALTEIADIEERITGQQSEQRTAINSINKEAEDRRKAAAEAEKQRRLEALNEAKAQLDAELRLYNAKNGVLAKNEAQLQAIAEENHKRRLQIINAEFAASEKKQSDQINRNAAIQEADNELLATKLDLAQQINDRELELYKERNSKILTENKFVSDEIYNQELNRLTGLQQAEEANLSTRLINKTISLEEYNLRALQIENDFNAQRDALQLERDAAEKAKAELDLINKLELAKNNFVLESELRAEQLEQQRQQELDAAEKTGADKALINAKYNQLEKENNRLLNENKLQLASDTFGSLATIAGKESAAGKAFAATQATIDTYKSAVSAYSAMSGIPIVGPALGAVAAGAAIAAGLANVKKIVSAPKPKFASGGIYQVGGRLHSAGGTTFKGSDGSTFEAEAGEGIGVLSRSEFGAFNAFRNSLQDIGNTVSYTGNGNASFLLEVVKNLPRPVVTVEDINTETGKYLDVISYADL